MVCSGSIDPKKTSLILLFFLSNFLARAQADVILQTPKKTAPQVRLSTSPVVSSSSGPVVPILLTTTTNSAFRVGEKLKFIIKYQFVGAGTASMTISEGPLVNNRPTLHLESRAESNGFVDKFFKVRDTNSSTIDKDSLASVFFHQNLREGNYHVMRNTTLDYKTGQFQYEKNRKGKTKSESGFIDQPLQDILSSFFYTRTLPLELGQEYSINVFSDGDVYALKVKVYPKTQDINVPAGRFHCLRVEPMLVGDAIFKAKEGKMTIWLTNDERRMPVLLRSKVFIGSFDAELLEYEPKL